MYPSNPRDERRHYPIILQGLKHIGVMETPENCKESDAHSLRGGGGELGN
jgi:hypothetical protein